eukprot:1361782-Prymnesium_polylepis.2
MAISCVRSSDANNTQRPRQGGRHRRLGARQKAHEISRDLTSRRAWLCERQSNSGRRLGTKGRRASKKGAVARLPYAARKMGGCAASSATKMTR